MVKVTYKLLLFGHCSLIRNTTQTAVINIVHQRIFILFFSYCESFPTQATFESSFFIDLEGKTFAFCLKIEEKCDVIEGRYTKQRFPYKNRDDGKDTRLKSVQRRTRKILHGASYALHESYDFYWFKTFQQTFQCYPNSRCRGPPKVFIRTASLIFS